MSNRKAEGIDATNQAFSRYDQVEKRQEYHRVPICDLGRFLRGNESDKQAFAVELGDALRRLGFAILEGHGVDPALHDEADARILEVFTQVPLEEKMRYRAQRFGSVNQGYFPIKETTDIHPDLVEGWVFCPRAFDLDDDPAYREEDFWPRSGFEPLFRRVVEAHGRLNLTVMQSLLRSLG